MLVPHVKTAKPSASLFLPSSSPQIPTLLFNFYYWIQMPMLHHSAVHTFILGPCCWNWSRRVEVGAWTVEGAAGFSLRLQPSTCSSKLLERFSRVACCQRFSKQKMKWCSPSLDNLLHVLRCACCLDKEWMSVKKARPSCCHGRLEQGVWTVKCWSLLLASVKHAGFFLLHSPMWQSVVFSPRPWQVEAAGTC
ncbi:uncharacterized protein HKW66_Vig0210900 [Vigna angularis]|uniref:Uncharacterized protein n=2 Tax=Phaseolus angularis TaxID=3914 RepID=A0A8T0JFS0_PHAAN|nr:uncharacterized protein HKW66_Vig0210900 [Vigna angularis]BAT92804.1 hypothetical protein VIGAN_07164400 [Vigna angularis var. angularis]